MELKKLLTNKQNDDIIIIENKERGNDYEYFKTVRRISYG